MVIAKDGVAKLTDFGVSTDEDNPSNDFEFTNKLATLETSAPEVIESRKFSKASDWWSFGCLLFEMATGQNPFHEMTSF